MRIIDLHCYPNTEPWIKSQGPYVEALAQYWNRSWTGKSQTEVIEEFKKAAVGAVLVAGLFFGWMNNLPSLKTTFYKKALNGMMILSALVGLVTGLLYLYEKFWGR